MQAHRNLIAQPDGRRRGRVVMAVGPNPPSMGSSLCSWAHGSFGATIKHPLYRSRIKGKIVVWIRNFLHNRRYKAVASEMILGEHVISGVPQGRVLEPHFFIIMISDIDNNHMI